MFDMHPQLPENSDEITLFITEGTHRLAIIFFNDYGYLQSARMAQTYLDKATLIMESKRFANRLILPEVKLLKASAGEIAREYVQFETFCLDCERFNHLATSN